MRKLILLAFTLVMSAGSLMLAGPAHAQATRTWVSGVGNDADPCSRTAPCKTFAGAISKTAAKGEINCLDPGGFGGVTITKAITISCDNTKAGVLAGATNAITVNTATATDVVILEGLDIEGDGVGLNGVRILKGSVYIRKTTIRNFLTGAPNGNAVIVFGPANTRVFITDSMLANNVNGVDVQGNAASNAAVLDNVLLDKNSGFSLKVGATSSAIISGTTMVGSANSIIAVAGATITSYGNNLIRNAGTPTETLPLQ